MEVDLPLGPPNQAYHRARVDFIGKYADSHLRLSWWGMYSLVRDGMPIPHICRLAGIDQQQFRKIYSDFFRSLCGDMPYEEFCVWLANKAFANRLPHDDVLRFVARHALLAGMKVETVASERWFHTRSLRINNEVCRLHTFAKSHASYIRIAPLQAVERVILVSLEPEPVRAHAVPRSVLLEVSSRGYGGSHVRVELDREYPNSYTLPRAA